MPDLHDYLSWRGDLNMRDVPLCEADLLILSEISYVAFPEEDTEIRGFGLKRTVGEAAKDLLDRDLTSPAVHQTFYLWKDNRHMLQTIGDAPRFGTIPLAGYTDELTDECQFAAMCFRTADDLTVICFRGTDDSAVGWKEDFYLSTDEPVPAQKRAAEYLAAAADALSGEFILAGHSKGGNLAVYAAATAEENVQNRIRQVINFDGPGFSEALLSSPGFGRIRAKTVQYLPENSLIGRLLMHGENRIVVKSAGFEGITEHAAFSWQIMRGSFVRAEKLSALSDLIHQGISRWLDTLDDDERRNVSNRLYQVLSRFDMRKQDENRNYLLRVMPGRISKLLFDALAGEPGREEDKPEK